MSGGDRRETKILETASEEDLIGSIFPRWLRESWVFSRVVLG